MPINTHQTHHTSAQALDAMTNKQRSARQNAVLNILLLALERGMTDMTCTEIARQHEANTGNGHRCDPSSFTEAINKLIAAKLITRHPDTRKCSVTTHPAAPVRLVLESRK